ncbi:hypothetical protein FBUS_01435 [Fasciolopsis buskii]|uniref:Uncharacterized protein n=1 Tax=Fasciolopsis buskii TaxID=27845 RepID=A0A8E0RUP3_9TREM|nr:hypothetical protein FBUS_01435 [Fasciolopsis buski]
MCLDRIFGCTVCSSRQCVAICDQKSKSNQIYPDKSDDDTFQSSLTSTGPSEVGPQAMLSATHCTMSEEKSQRQNQRVALLFCPMEEEIPNFSHSGDFEYFHRTINNMKGSMPNELLQESGICKQVERASCLNSRLSTENKCLLTFHDNPGHQLASLNHVGDLPSRSDSAVDIRTLDSCSSIRNTHGVPTIPDASTTMLINDPPGPTSTTAGLRWTLYEEDEGCARTYPNDSEHFRPPVPTRFSLQISSEGYPPICCSKSLYGEDARAGYTSTTREIRWTQFEKDMTPISEPCSTPNFPSPVRFNVASPRCLEPTCRSAVNTSLRSSKMDYSISNLHDPLKKNSSKVDSRTCPLEKLKDTVSFSSRIVSITDRTSHVNDLCMLPLLDEPPLFSQTLNEISWHGENSNKIKPPCNSVNADFTEYPRQCTTSMLVQYSPIHLPTSFYPDPSSSGSSDQQIRCGRCGSMRLRRQLIKHKSTQTIRRTKGDIAYLPNSSLNFVLISHPVGSEGPPVSLRWGLTQEFREVSWNSQLSKSFANSLLKTDNILRLSVSPFSRAHNRFTPDSSERLAPLRIGQRPIPKPVKFVPFEHLRPPTPYASCRSIKSTKARGLVQVDVNSLEGKTLSNQDLLTAGETCPSSVAQSTFYCTYVEVLIRRNLECVAPPSCLTCSESRMVFNLLDRKLQSAVSMRFLAGIQRSKKSPLVSSGSGPCIPEGGDSETMENGKPIVPDINLELGSAEKYPDHRKLVQLHKCHSILGSCRKRACGGAYVFTRGPQAVKPPREWLDHVRTEASGPDYKKVVAWKLDPAKLVVGGLINYDYHLQVIVSSKDGRLGATYTQADALMSEICRKGALYTKKKKRIIVPKDREVVAGIKELRTIASELAKSIPSAIRKDIQPVESVDFLYRKIMNTPKYIVNYTKLYLTDKIIDKLREKVTLYEGTLAHCIRPTAYCSTYLYPRASDPDAYHLYACFFDPVLKAINSISKLKLQQIPDYQLSSFLQSKVILPNVISYRVRFVRNITGYGFPPVMSLNDYLVIENICREALLSWREEGIGSWYSLHEFRDKHPALHKVLLKKNLLMPRKSAVRKVSGVYRFWPEGRAIYVAPEIHRDCDLVVQINGEDHLKVICVDWTGKQPNLVYARASKLMHWLDTRICFSRSIKWGFLSTAPENVGTGMQFSALVKLPNSVKDAELFDQICSRFQMQIRNHNTHGTTVLHNVFEIGLRSTFGRTEAELAAGFLHGLTKTCRHYAKQSS